MLIFKNGELASILFHLLLDNRLWSIFSL